MKHLTLFLTLIYLISCESEEKSNIIEQTIGNETYNIVKISLPSIFQEKKYKSQIVSTDGKYLYRILDDKNFKLLKYDIFQEKIVDSLMLPYQGDHIINHYILVNSRDNHLGILDINFDERILKGKSDNPYEIKHDLYLLNADLDSLLPISLSFPNNHLYTEMLLIHAYYIKDSNVYIIMEQSGAMIHNLRTQTVRYAECKKGVKFGEYGDDSIFDIMTEKFYLCNRFEYVKQYDVNGKEIFTFRFGKEDSYPTRDDEWYYYLYNGLISVSKKDNHLIWDISKNDTSNFQKIVENNFVHYWFKDGVGIENEDTLMLIYKQK